LRQSINFFNKAIEVDPLFALAYAGIADAYAVLGNQHSMVLSDAYSKAKAAALRALAIDDTLAEAYPTLGYIRGAYDRDWKGSEEAFRKAIILNPGYATAHQWYSAILRALGRVDEAIEEAQKAFSLDPLSPIINANVGLCLYVARRYEEAVDLFRRTITVEPEFFWSRYLLGLTLRQRGEHTSALTELRLALSLANDKPTEAVVLSDLAYTFGILRNHAEANRLIGELKALGKLHHVAPYDLAVAHLGVGDMTTAFDWLEEAYRTRDEGLLWLKVDPVLDEVRDHPRYLTLLKQVGLDEPS
jgi:tetratricopeptide (TPR) repeat protein